MNTLKIGKVVGIAAGVAGIYLIVYILILNSSANLKIALLMFAFSPLLILSFVYCVLKYGKFHGRNLKKGEEWGYDDVTNDK